LEKARTGTRSNPRVTDAVIQSFYGNLPNRPDGDCWLWEGELDSADPPYGYLRVYQDGDTYYVRAHRLSFYIAHGHWPEPLCGHDCRPRPDNRRCCNPDHLWEGTVADNNRDQSVKGVASNQHKGKRRCQRGHLWTAENTIWRMGKTGPFRECRTCSLNRKAKQRRTNLSL
jgi:hypothetical protein